VVAKNIQTHTYTQIYTHTYSPMSWKRCERGCKIVHKQEVACGLLIAKVGRFASQEVILELILKMFTNSYLWIGDVCFA